MPKNNVWRWTAKDKDGNPVEAAPGAPVFHSRGPESEAEMRREAQRVLNARMQLEWYESGESPDWVNPAYRVDTVEPQGFSDAGVQPVGMWKPPNARPITMPEAPAEPAPQP
jgi:hypothetical protein